MLTAALAVAIVFLICAAVAEHRRAEVEEGKRRRAVVEITRLRRRLHKYEPLGLVPDLSERGLR